MSLIKKSLFLLLLLILGGNTASVFASIPYESYVYDHNTHPVAIPVSYVPVDVWDGLSSGSGLWNTPSDLKIGKNGYVYVSDTGNNRVVVLNSNGKVHAIWGIKEPKEKETNDPEDLLNQPQGLFLDEEDHLYVCDTGNQRIVKFDTKGQVLQVFKQPSSELLPKSFIYRPLRIVVDPRGELFIVNQGLYEGMLEMGSNGAFIGFFGANRVPFNLNQYLLKAIATKEQRDQMSKSLPAEFSSVAMDKEGFIYSTTLRLEYNQIKKISSVGVDVMNKAGEKNIYGDQIEIYNGTTKTLPQLVGIVVDERGIITVLDGANSRFFQYDQSKHLLSVFGGKGTSLGLMQSAVALDATSDSRWIYALDSGMARLTRYRATEFTAMLHHAITLYNDGQYVESKAPLQRILDIDSHYDLANLGIGNAFLKKEQYAEALNYYKRGYEKTGYSNAFVLLRMNWLRNHFVGFILLVIILYLSIWYIPWIKHRLQKRKSNKGKGWFKSISKRLKIMLHPLEGFEGLKNKEMKLTYWLMFLLLTLLCIVRIIDVEYTSFPLNNADPSQTSLLIVCIFILVPWFTWCLVNYGLSALLDGEGSVKEVFAGSVYCFMPYLIGQPILVLLSHILTTQEHGLYIGLEYALLVWVAILFFIQTMIMQQYTFGKTVMIVLLTLFGMLIVWFLGTILYAMTFQLTRFITGIYREIYYRR